MSRSICRIVMVMAPAGMTGCRALEAAKLTPAKLGHLNLARTGHYRLAATCAFRIMYIMSNRGRLWLALQKALGAIQARPDGLQVQHLSLSAPTQKCARSRRISTKRAAWSAFYISCTPFCNRSTSLHSVHAFLPATRLPSVRKSMEKFPADRWQTMIAFDRKCLVG
ncbi:protein of unknown function [Cupriavidus neocaledonicus]|uniref:Uncharacterized protein n=1 Tax=Cupriavidus neocaledonicus TaxID=1040979 RepID=A0A375H938_9BURK|nr:protein of unknown function [Cupriavidus neocaledonicus]